MNARRATQQARATLSRLATDATLDRRFRSGFTVEETDAILAEHYPWAKQPAQPEGETP